MEGASTGQVKFYPYKKKKKRGGGVRRRFMSTAGHLRIDKGSRCVLRYTYILLITLMAFVLL